MCTCSRFVFWPSSRLAVSNKLPPTGDEPSAHLFQLVAHAPVNDLIANTDDDAADNVRIDLERQLDLLASHCFQLLADVIQFGVCEPFRGRHFSHGEAPLSTQLIVEY